MDELAAGQVPPVRRGSVRGEEHHLRAHHRGAPHAQGKPVFFLEFKAWKDLGSSPLNREDVSFCPDIRDSDLDAIFVELYRSNLNLIASDFDLQL